VTFLEWILISTLVVIYFCLLFTVAVMTFRKGHFVLGIFGIFFPFLWLLGAVLPAMPGSSYDEDEIRRHDAELGGAMR
jgi:hypothetical protein